MSIGRAFGQDSTPEVKDWLTKARQHLIDQPDSCLYYVDFILDKAGKQGDYWAISKSLSYSAWVKEKRGQIYGAIIDYYEALRWMAEADTIDDVNNGTITRNIANIQMDFKNYEHAQIFYDSALFFFNRHVNNHPKVAKEKNHYRHIYSTKYFKVEGLRRLGKELKAQEVLEDLLKDKNTPRGTRINSLYQLAFLFNDLDEIDSARSYFQKGIEFPGASPSYIGRGFHNLAMISFQQKEFLKAIVLYKEAISYKTDNSLKRNLSNRKSLFISLMDLGESFLREGKLDSAQHYLNRSLTTLDSTTINVNPDYYIIYHLMSKASGSNLEANWKYQDKFISCNNAFLGTQQKIKDEARRRALYLSLDQYRAEIRHQEEVNDLDRKYSNWVIAIILLAAVGSVLGAKYWLLHRKKRFKRINQVLRPRETRIN